MLVFLKVTLPYFVRSRGRAEAPSVNGLCGCVGHDVTAAAPLTADGFLPGRLPLNPVQKQNLLCLVEALRL